MKGRLNIMVLRAKTKDLFDGKPLTPRQQDNSNLNMKELESGEIYLRSFPRRLIFELTNACNLNCIMCGRNAAEFKPTFFDIKWIEYFKPMLDIVEEVTLMGWGEPTLHPDFTKILETIDCYSARKYFCTNGMRLEMLKDAIFEYHVDVFAVSLDGANKETNDRIRRGADFEKVIKDLREIIYIRNDKKLKYPWINFVFCAMRSNLYELPDVIRIAADIGIDEVKVVYLTAFDLKLEGEVLWGCVDEVRKVFDEAIRLSESLGVAIKLPHIQGEDEAGDKEHKDCFVSWRDFFLGSDGYIRPCMSTPIQFEKFDMSKPFGEMWNSENYQRYRDVVNDSINMDFSCRRCYQSSHCNWNKKETWLQMNQLFSPEWKK